MEELLSLKGNAPEFQVSSDGIRFHYDYDKHVSVEYTPEERACFVDELAEKTRRIFELGESVSKAFVEIGYLLCEIQNKRLVYFACIRSQTFVGIEDFAFKVFGFQKSTTYNLMRIVEEFGDGEDSLSKEYCDYSYTQLVNLLPFTGYERKMFTPEATVGEIKELRAGLKKYPRTECRSTDFGKTITWRSELDRVRKAAAEEAASEKKDKKEERKQGLLSILNAAETSEPSSSPSAAAAASVETVVEVVAPPEDKVKLELKNREERKKWVEGVFEGASPYWTLPELELKIYRYVFVNDARLFRFVGVTYWETWSTEPGREDTMSKYFITDDKCPKFDMCRSRSVNQVVDWLTEHSKEI